MATQKDMIIGTTIHHLKQFVDGPPQVDQHFVNPIPWNRALSLAKSAMRTAMKFQAAMRLSQNAHLLMKRLLVWYATEGRKLILEWQAESKCDAEKLREDLKNPNNDDLLLDSAIAFSSAFHWQGATIICYICRVCVSSPPSVVQVCRVSQPPPLISCSFTSLPISLFLSRASLKGSTHRMRRRRASWIAMMWSPSWAKMKTPMKFNSSGRCSISRPSVAALPLKLFPYESRCGC